MMNLLTARPVAVFALIAVAIPSVAQFSMTNTDPAQNATDVPVNMTIMLEFSLDIDPVSAANSFAVVSKLRGMLPFTVSVSGNSATLTPAVAFVPSEEIGVTIFTTLKSTTAIPLTSPRTFVFLATTQPSFTTPPNFVEREVGNVGGHASMAPVDMDKDNDIDICFLGTSIGWLENDGAGNFTKRVVAVPEGAPNRITPIDIDRDGDIDFVTTTTFDGILIYTNDGAQNFGLAATINGNSIDKIDIVDFNGDGLPDLVYSGRELINQEYINGTYILYNEGGVTFSKTKISSSMNYSTRCADMDNDGDFDIIQNHQGSELNYVLNTDTHFTTSAIFTESNYYIEDFDLADLNNDQYLDIVVSRSGNVEIWLNQGSQQFTQKLIESSIALYSSVGDFDGDHDLDIVIIDGNYIYTMFENDGTANFVRQAVAPPLDGVFYPTKGVNADFDGDGDLDFVASPQNGPLIYFENSILPFAKDVTAEIISLEVGDADWGDFDNDGDLDLLATGIHENEPATALYENQEGQFVERQTSLPPSFAGSVDWGDFDKDGDLDILLIGAAMINIDERNPMSYIYVNDGGSFNLLQSSTLQLPKAWHGEARWADFDNDGWLDIVYNANGSSSIYQSDGNGNFTIKYELPHLFTHGNVATGDYDNDGDLDVAVSGWRGNDELGAMLKVFRNDGQFEFHDIQGEFVGRIGGNLSWSDMDMDGDLDLVVSGETRFSGGGGVPSVTVYEQSNGAFKAVDNGEPLYHTDTEGTTATGDFDNDGIPDVIASTQGSSSYAPAMTLLKNDGHGVLNVHDVYLPKIVSRVINCVDYDQDHDLDLFAGSALIRNNVDVKNTPPSPPALVQVDSVYNNTIYFQWSAGNDAETNAAGLSHQLYVGTESHAQNIVNSNSELATGFRRVAEPGNSGTVARVGGLTGGVYYYGVQAVDASFEGSPFSVGEILVVAIHGAPAACSGFNASYVAKPAGNYTWDVTGGTIVSGQGADALVVHWGSPGKGYIKLSNGAGFENTLEVHIDEMPQPVIVGDPTVCTGVHPFSVTDDLTDVTEWNFPNVHALQNQVENTASINWKEAGDYNLIVKAFSANKGCFTYDTLQVMIDQRPSVTISVNSIFSCQEKTEEYRTASSNPVWEVINGQRVESEGQTISIRWGNIGEGTVIAYEKSLREFCTDYDTLTVTVSPIPVKPSLSLLQDTIIVSSPSPTGNYKWYYNGELALSGNYRGVIPVLAGTFVVEVFNSFGCGSKSDPFDFLVTDDESFTVYPNPAGMTTSWRLTKGNVGDCDLEIYSMSGSMTGRFSYRKGEHSQSGEIDISHLRPGIYVIELKTKTVTYRRRLIKR